MQQPLEIQLYLREHGLQSLCDNYGIKAKRHGQWPHLVLLKYSQINSPRDSTLVQQCRGIILDESRNWNIVARPFDRFFNAGEALAATLDWNTARVFPKYDGSLMFLYYYKGWNVSSSGVPDASGPMGNDPEVTMADFFWRAWRALGCKLPEAHLVGHTFMFELCSVHNRVVVQQNEPYIVAIGWRNEKGQEMDLRGLPERLRWQVAQGEYVRDLSLVARRADELDPLKGEGFVISDHHFNRLKVKSPAYVALHHLKGSFCARRLMELVQRGETEEFLAHFPEFEAEYRQIADAYSLFVFEAEELWVDKGHIANQKEFAMAVKGSPHAGYGFACKAGKTSDAHSFYGALPPDKMLKRLDIAVEGQEKETND